MKKFVYPIHKFFHTKTYQKLKEQKEMSSFNSSISSSSKETLRSMSTNTSYLTITPNSYLHARITNAKKNRQGMLQRIASMEDLHATVGKEQAIHTGKRRSWECTQTI